MTPAARVQAAIEVLAPILQGAPAERELLAWSRRSRFAGSGDRAAVRDHVFDALRGVRRAAWIGGQGAVALPQMDPRAVMAGLLSVQGQPVDALFDGSRHGPAPWPDFAPVPLEDAPRAVRLDMPDWVLPLMDQSLGSGADAILARLGQRAPVHLRARGDRAALCALLAAAGHVARPHPLASTAIALEGQPRGLTALPAHAEGAFEFQDAGSQALVAQLPLRPGMRVLDLCAGGGGKALAIAARLDGPVWAHDAEAQRLRDLPARAARAGADIRILPTPEAEAPFDLVVCDVPCSGSGAWRRQPEGRWRLTPERLQELIGVQRGILDRAVGLVRPGGLLAYMTCSLLEAENAAQVAAAVAAHPLSRLHDWASTPLQEADGFYLGLMRHESC